MWVNYAVSARDLQVVAHYYKRPKQMQRISGINAEADSRMRPAHARSAASNSSFSFCARPSDSWTTPSAVTTRYAGMG